MPLLVEQLLGALEDAPLPAPRCWLLVGGLALSYLLFLLTSPVTTYLATALGLRVQSTLLALGTAKSALLARGERNAGEQALLVSRYAAALTVLFENLLPNTLVPAAAACLAAVNLGRLLGAPTAAAAIGLLGLVTGISIWLRRAMKTADRGTTKYAQLRVALLLEALANAAPLRALGWEGWAAERVRGAREPELRTLRDMQMARVLLDTLQSVALPAVVLVTFLCFAAFHGGSAPTPSLAFAAVTWLTYLSDPLKIAGYFLQVTLEAQIDMERLLVVLARSEAPVDHMAAWAATATTTSSSGGAASKELQPSAALLAVERALAEYAAAGRASGAAEGGAVDSKDCVAAGFETVEEVEAVEVADSEKEEEESEAATQAHPAPISAAFAAAPPPLLQFSSAAISYPPAPPLLTGVQFSVAPGTLTLLLGGMGTGKSSVLRAVLGDAHLASGHAQVSCRIAFVPQDPWLQAVSVRECVTGLFAGAWGGGAEKSSWAWYETVLRATALSEDVKRLAGRDLAQVGPRGQNLSVGTRARLALARAIFSCAREGQPPTLFVIDDVFSAVDVKVGRKLWRSCIVELLLRKGHGVLLATHALHLASHKEVGQIVVLSRGTMLACGPYAAVQGLLRGSEQELSGGAGDAPTPSPGAGTPSPVREEEKEGEASQHPTAPPTQETDTLAMPSLSAFLTYAHALPFCPLIIALFVAVQVLALAQSFWLRTWASGEYESVPLWVWSCVGYTRAPPSPGSEAEGAAAGMYGLLGAAAAVCIFARTLLLALSSLAASRSLHEKALKGLLGASLAALSGIKEGAVRTRFEKDFARIDVWLRYELLRMLVTWFSLAGTVAAVALTSLFMLAGVSVLLLLFLLLGNRYKRAVVPLRALSSTTSTGLAGLWGELCVADAAATLRGGGPRAVAASVVAVLQAQAPLLRTSIAVDAGAALASNFLFAAGALVMIGGAAAAVAAVGEGTLSPSSAALLLTYCYTFPNDIQYACINSGYLEQSIVSVARLKEYMDLQPEDGAQAPLLPSSRSPPPKSPRSPSTTPRAGANRATSPAPRESSAPLLLNNVWLRYSAAPLVGGSSRGDVEEPLLGAEGGEGEGACWVLRGLTAAIPSGSK